MAWMVQEDDVQGEMVTRGDRVRGVLLTFRATERRAFVVFDTKNPSPPSWYLMEAVKGCLVFICLAETTVRIDVLLSQPQFSGWWSLWLLST